jgi:hypothetical protein
VSVQYLDLADYLAVGHPRPQAENSALAFPIIIRCEPCAQVVTGRSREES